MDFDFELNDYNNEKIKCPECGFIFSAESFYCPECGLLVINDYRCINHKNIIAKWMCVVCQTPLCDNCVHFKLGRAFCEVHLDTFIIDGHLPVFKTGSPWVAYLVLGRLKQSGIPCVLFNQHDSSYSINIGDLSFLRIMVPLEFYEKAIQELKNNRKSVV